MVSFYTLILKKALRFCVPAVFILSLFVSCVKPGDLDVQQGSRLFQQKKFSEAKELFELALTEECSYSPESLYIMISNCYSQQGEYDTAIEWRKKSLETMPDDTENYLNLGMIYRLKNDEETAEDFFKKALALAPEDADANASLGTLYLAQGRNTEALPLLEKALEAKPTQGLLHADLAVCYARLHLFSKAEEEYQQAVKYRAPHIDQFRAELDALMQ